MGSEDEQYNAYVNWVSNYLEEKNSEFFGESKIDRKQMYKELKLHRWAFDNGFFTENANPAEIEIYSDGAVKDGRWYVNLCINLFPGGGYE